MIEQNHQRRAMPQGALPVIKAEPLQPDAPMKAWDGGPADIAKPRSTREGWHPCHQCDEPAGPASTLCLKCLTEAKKEYSRKIDEIEKADNTIIISGLLTAIAGVVCLGAPITSIGAVMLSIMAGIDTKNFLQR